MKVFLSCDIEGTCGITDWAEATKGTEDYRYFQKQMTKEVKAACEGATLGGAESIFIKDAHSTARNIIPDELPLNTIIMRGWGWDPLMMMSGLEREEYKAVLFTGYHSDRTSNGNPLAHVMNLKVGSITINGIIASEFLINCYIAGYYGVPVCFISGDKAICEEANKFIPEITTVPVFEGVGGATISIHPEAALQLIKEGAKKAVENASKCKVPMPSEFDVSIKFIDQQAYKARFYPGASLEDEKTVRFKSADYHEVLCFLLFVLI